MVWVNRNHFLKDRLAIHIKLFKVAITWSLPTETDTKNIIRGAQHDLSRKFAVALLITLIIIIINYLQGVSASALLTFDVKSFFAIGAVLSNSIPDLLDASSHHASQVVTTENVFTHCKMLPEEGQNQLRLRTTRLKHGMSLRWHVTVS